MGLVFVEFVESSLELLQLVYPVFLIERHLTSDVPVRELKIGVKHLSGCVLDHLVLTVVQVVYSVVDEFVVVGEGSERVLHQFKVAYLAFVERPVFVEKWCDVIHTELVVNVIVKLVLLLFLVVFQLLFYLIVEVRIELLVVTFLEFEKASYFDVGCRFFELVLSELKILMVLQVRYVNVLGKKLSFFLDAAAVDVGVLEVWVQHLAAVKPVPVALVVQEDFVLHRSQLVFLLFGELPDVEELAVILVLLVEAVVFIGIAACGVKVVLEVERPELVEVVRFVPF